MTAKTSTRTARPTFVSGINHVSPVPPQPIPVNRPTAKKPGKIAKWWAKGHKITLNGKGKWLVLVLIALTFFGGIALGEKSATSRSDYHAPDAKIMSVLDYAKASGGKGCKVVWNETYKAHTVVCDHPVQLVNQDADRDPQK